jgi:hypothetical protein
LVYFNGPAEKLLGLRYEEVGEIPAAEWSTIFVPTDENGDPMPPAVSDNILDVLGFLVDQSLVTVVDDPPG